VEKALRVSVRELVAFCFPPEDIILTSGVGDMLAGTKAHRATQQRRDAEIEKTISHSFSISGEEITLFGRMDAFTGGDIPLVEEMKHSSWQGDAAAPDHRAQAICYAAMVALEMGCERVRFCVSYVTTQGEVRRAYEECMDVGELIAQLEEWLTAYVKVALREREHRARRDASLQAMVFPYSQYRAGQRELARQVYTAVVRKRRLFASLPTGTGKSVAVLFPALKALGEGKTGKLLYLTSRNTARQSPLEALQRMLENGAAIRVSMLTAREKMCPHMTRCHPDDCPRAKGHFLREADAVEELLAVEGCWTDQFITAVADRHQLCPFELALKLTELADVILMDLNYAFDPFAQLKRLFQQRRDMTLLIDEAHHVVDRVRESLSGEMDSAFLCQHRAAFGRICGRKHKYYQALTALIHALRKQPPPLPEEREWQEAELQDDLLSQVEKVLEEATMVASMPHPPGIPDVFEVIRLCLPFLHGAEMQKTCEYAILWQAKGKERSVCLYCLSPAPEIARITAGQRGAVFFSATLSPLSCMKQLLGGEEGDACFALPSPFPEENLRVVGRRISTRYQDRETSAAQVAQCIAEMVRFKEGNYLVFFPGYAYLKLVLAHLNEDELPEMWIQTPQMTEEDRAAFFEAFSNTSRPVLGLCVLGGLFSEGIDLPGDQLIGAMIVGVGLPTPSQKLSAIRTCYDQRFGDGFHYACRIPAMQKVQQAGGRVIRSERDQGVLVLVDDRYFTPAYRALLPEHWRLRDEALSPQQSQE